MTSGVDADPWAWARDTEADDAHRTYASVTAVVVAHNAEAWIERCLDSLGRQSLRPARVVVVDAESTDDTPQLLDRARRRGLADDIVPGTAGATFGESVARALPGEVPEWVWLLHDDTSADADALARLVAAAHRTPAAVVGPVLIEPRRRRGRAVRVSEAGQTLTEDGMLTGVVAEGVLDQGQLAGGPVLGLNSAGLLVRGDVWKSLGGFDPAMPSSVQGLEFCWRARLHGHEVVCEPRARLAHVEASTRGMRGPLAADPEQERRRWGLTLNEAYRAEALSTTVRARIAGASTRRVFGFLLGKDLLDARIERRAVREYRADRASIERLRKVYSAAVGEGPPVDVSPLRLTRRTLRARRLDETFGRIVDWLAAFGDRGGTLGLDALTGDDFAHEQQGRRRLSPTWILAWVLVVLALVASRSLFAAGPLSGSQLLAVPETFGALFDRWTAPVPGVAPSAGAPWIGLLWTVSLATFGHPDLVVGIILLAAVPLSFLLARRVLGRLVDDRAVALVGALLYALVPVVSGAVGAGQLGTALFAVLLPVLANRLLLWSDERDAGWPVAGAVALTTTALTAVQPLTWAIVATALLVLWWRERSAWPRVLVAGAAPLALLAVSPFTAQVIRYPGRLLTGPDPLLAPASAPSVLDVLLVRTGGTPPPVGVSLVVIGAIWLLGVAGAALRPRPALWALTVALGAATVAVVLGRVAVPVPPTGEWVRPQTSAWLVLMAGALIWAASVGLDGLRAEIARTVLGRLHAVVYAAAVVSLAAALVGSGWWVAFGHEGLRRGQQSAVPAFIRKEAATGTSRVLSLHYTGDRVGWTLLENDFLHLGDGERGLVFGGDPAAVALAASVSNRLASGAADEAIAADLQRLGVAYVWVTGASADQRLAVSNAPGLGVESTDDLGSSWTVPDSGRFVLVQDGRRTKIDPTKPLPPGPDGRVLVRAEPASVAGVSLNGRPLDRVADVDSNPAFAVPAEGGTLDAASQSGFGAWTVLQVLGFLVLVLLAAPASRADDEARSRTPRRASRAGEARRGRA